jgi:CRISPR type I-E-associated protein CasA/Cse1
LRNGDETTWASPVEVLCGERDGVDLDYPRDDFRVFARLLLSALVQALFPAKTCAELERRLAAPMTRAEVLQRLRTVEPDFDLFGPRPFLQIAPPPLPPAKGAAPFVFGKDDLTQPAVRVDAVSLPIALMTLYAEQVFAGGAGRGHSPGPGGQPGAFTLVDPGSVRAAAWANTLALETARPLYAPEERVDPWTSAPRPARRRDAVSLVEGIFFQPRGIWLLPAEDGVCTFMGVRGPRVRFSPFTSKSKLVPKVPKVEDIWVHPNAPMFVNSIGLGPVHLDAERPAWTGLAQLLTPVSRAKGKQPRVQHPRAGAAPVVQQWRTLRPETRAEAHLIVLDYERDKAVVRRRFFESYRLADLGDAAAVARIRARLDQAQDIERLLTWALSRASDKKLDISSARTAFWMETEADFLEWLYAGAPEVEEAPERLRSLARRVFDREAQALERPSTYKDLVGARRWLTYQLWPPQSQEQERKAP